MKDDSDLQLTTPRSLRCQFTIGFASSAAAYQSYCDRYIQLKRLYDRPVFMHLFHDTLSTDNIEMKFIEAGIKYQDFKCEISTGLVLKFMNNQLSRNKIKDNNWKQIFLLGTQYTVHVPLGIIIQKVGLLPGPSPQAIDSVSKLAQAL